MIRSLICGLLCCWTSVSLASPDFAGTYQCKGHDPYLNRDYTGTIVIKQQKTVYHVDMAYDTGDKYIGTAGLFGDDSITLVFQSTKNLKTVGLERYAYAHGDHHIIQGYWVYLGKDKLGTEVCEKQQWVSG